ncbi:DNA-binding transcriptional MerR regulator [Melghiribacillus thermohalophilus]|uniref:DNA-binding transcriptional MerR regulator n=1 Tax=Melghiribacillus thermohalophilus TaxID=1324956 RepID=A0A4R3MYZ1_9BACI|nr:MerR family DNA-binding transcriptional regulator [Melghiribacillus thermohalophilus]TCT20881.1 DNA-binding transcriptional MerR regulator [Melghiribacillus thermohalophilus]
MEQTYTISDLAHEFDISTRTIRYYEERGLIHPGRTEGGQRIYSRKDRTHLRLILRGKRFGFSLEEIAEMINMFDQDRSGKKQLEVTIQYGRKKIKEVDEKIQDMVALREEMESLLQDFQSRLQQLKGEESR